MLIIEKTLGNASDAGWAERLRGASKDLLHLDQWEAQKSRVRKTTEAGVEIALSLDRKAQLHDGDILAWDAAKKVVIMAQIALNDVMIVDLSGLDGSEHEAVVRTMFELGHALGNQHWPAIVKDGRVYVPLTVDRRVMASVMKTHGFAHIRYDFAPGLEVLPYMTPHEARRLFGGASQSSHSHSEAGSREHTHTHVHEHTHADGQTHTHEHRHVHEHAREDDNDHDHDHQRDDSHEHEHDHEHGAKK